jgi:hypothetical protein
MSETTDEVLLVSKMEYYGPSDCDSNNNGLCKYCGGRSWKYNRVSKVTRCYSSLCVERRAEERLDKWAGKMDATLGNLVNAQFNMIEEQKLVRQNKHEMCQGGRDRRCVVCVEATDFCRCNPKCDKDQRKVAKLTPIPQEEEQPDIGFGYLQVMCDRCGANDSGNCRCRRKF